MTKKMTKEAMETLIAALRSRAPKRPLTYGESLSVARRQAALLRQLLGAKEEALDLDWLIEQKALLVNHLPSHELGEDISGKTTNAQSPREQLYINSSEPVTRQRFTTLHEFKHALDWRDADILHARLGSGYKEQHDRMIESICNEFAAQALMPMTLVKRVWLQTQDLADAARHFNVSFEAMRIRLERLGLIDKPETFFRSVRTIAHYDLTACIA